MATSTALVHQHTGTRSRSSHLSQVVISIRHECPGLTSCPPLLSWQSSLRFSLNLCLPNVRPAENKSFAISLLPKLLLSPHLSFPFSLQHQPPCNPLLAPPHPIKQCASRPSLAAVRLPLLQHARRLQQQPHDQQLAQPHDAVLRAVNTGHMGHHKAVLHHEASCAVQAVALCQ